MLYSDFCPLFLAVISVSSTCNKALRWYDYKDMRVNKGGIRFNKYSKLVLFLMSLTKYPYFYLHVTLPIYSN